MVRNFAEIIHGGGKAAQCKSQKMRNFKKCAEFGGLWEERFKR